MRGRKPKPTKLRILEGNAEHRPINENEVEPEPLTGTPEFLSDDAREEWDRILSSMPPGFYTEADVPTLTVYCVAWVAYQELLIQLSDEGYEAKGSTGQRVAHPLLAVMQKQVETILKASDRLGMSPVARTRLEMPGKSKQGKFDGLIGGRNG